MQQPGDAAHHLVGENIMTSFAHPLADARLVQGWTFEVNHHHDHLIAKGFGAGQGVVTVRLWGIGIGDPGEHIGIQRCKHLLRGHIQQAVWVEHTGHLAAQGCPVTNLLGGGGFRHDEEPPRQTPPCSAALASPAGQTDQLSEP